MFRTPWRSASSRANSWNASYRLFRPSYLLMLGNTGIMDLRKMLHLGFLLAVFLSQSSVSEAVEPLNNYEPNLLQTTLPQQPPPPLTLPQNVIQIVESEIYNSTSEGQDRWIGASHRWTTIHGQPSEPPPSLPPPKGYTFEGDWKIVTSKIQRDSMGWEYIWRQNQPSMRQRLWLRTIVAIKPPPPVAISPEKKTGGQKKIIAFRPRQTIKSWISIVKDDWNFKGYGMSFYKSLLFLDSFGVSFRLPILSNFNWWERRPALPSLANSLTLYYPWTIIYGFSSSLDVDFVAWLLGRTVKIGFWTLSIVLWSIAQLLLAPLGAISRVTMDKVGVLRQPFPKPSRPVYSMTIQQRVGMSVSWRISQLRGYEFRVSYWYSFLPTILCLLEYIIQQQQKRRIHGHPRVRQSESSEDDIELSQLQKGLDSSWADWLRRKTASVGLEGGTPLPIPPYHFASAMFSINGLTFHRPKPRKSVSATGANVGNSPQSSSSNLVPVDDDNVNLLDTSSSSSSAAVQQKIATSAGS